MKLNKLKIVYMSSLIAIFVIFLGFVVLNLRVKRENIIAKNSYIESTDETIKYIPLEEREKTIIHTVTSSDISSIDSSKKTILFFLTSWCPHCIDEIESLKEAQKQSQNVNYIIVSHDKNREDIARFLNEKEANFFVLWDPNKYIRTALNKEDNTVPGAYLLGNEKNIIEIKKETLNVETILELINK